MAREKRFPAGTHAPVPRERHATARRQILALISERPRSAKEISADVRIPEKEVSGHLDHLRRSLHREGRRIEVTPAECLDCGFVYRKRERFGKPGRCPVCRGESVSEPLYFLGERFRLTRAPTGSPGAAAPSRPGGSPSSKGGRTTDRR